MNDTGSQQVPYNSEKNAKTNSHYTSRMNVESQERIVGKKE